LLCQSANVDGVAVKRFSVLSSSCFLFSLGGFFLSLCFCGVLVWDRLLFLLCLLGFVSMQSGGDSGSGGG